VLDEWELCSTEGHRNLADMILVVISMVAIHGKIEMSPHKSRQNQIAISVVYRYLEKKSDADTTARPTSTTGLQTPSRLSQNDASKKRFSDRLTMRVIPHLTRHAIAANF
jgi:hypothetical protein